MHKIDFKKLRKRFAKDYNLPINLFNDELWDYYMSLYEFFPKEEYDNLLKTVEEKYDGNVDLWLDYCAKVRDNAIIGTMETEAYQEFNKKNMSEWDIPAGVPQIGEHSVYNEETDGRFFVSIDLKKANFQALKFAGVINDETYKDFVYRNGGDDYIVGSKYLRQVIFGKMNPGRTIKVEKFIMGKIYLLVKDFFENNGYELYSFNSDELVFAEKNYAMFGVEGGNANVKRVEQMIKDSLGIDARVEYIYITRLPIVNVNGNKVDAFVKRNVITGESELKKASTTFYPQIYKLWQGHEIEEIDRKFFFEDQIATFNEPLRYDENTCNE
jgi:hypothetical protein